MSKSLTFNRKDLVDQYISDVTHTPNALMFWTKMLCPIAPKNKMRCLVLPMWLLKFQRDDFPDPPYSLTIVSKFDFYQHFVLKVFLAKVIKCCVSLMLSANNGASVFLVCVIRTY